MKASHRVYLRLTLTFFALVTPLLVAIVLVRRAILIGGSRGEAGASIAETLGISLASDLTVCLVAAVGVSLIAAAVSLRFLVRSVGAIREALSRLATGGRDTVLSSDQQFLVEQLAPSLTELVALFREKSMLSQSSRDHLQTVLDSMVEGVVAVDREQRITLVNDALCDMFRIHEQAVLGRPFWEVVRYPALHEWVAAALQRGQPVMGEFEVLGPTNRHLACRAVRLPAETPGAVLVVSDLSQLRRLELVRQQFVSNASHELKTPLAAIKASIETLLDGAVDDIEYRGGFLKTIDEQADRLDRLVQDMLGLARLETVGSRAERCAVAVDDVIRKVQARQQARVDRAEMRLVLQPPRQPLTIWGDDESLEQILDNLFDNAIKYSEQGGCITCRWFEEDETCVIDVADTGIGIPQAHIDRIFERFYRVDRARSREMGGTGLGLAIVKHHAQSMGGTVSVTSRQGHGSTFRVTLPLAPPSSP